MHSPLPFEVCELCQYGCYPLRGDMKNTSKLLDVEDRFYVGNAISSTAIPTSGTKLRDRLVKIITDYRTETSLRHGCNDILKADCVNLLVKYYKEARHAIYLSNEEDETRAKRGDSRASQATERPLSMKTMEVKSKTRGGGRCCMCFDPFSIQNVSVIAFFCCHAYHMNCLMDSTYSVSGKQGKGATSQETASDYDEYDNSVDGEDDASSGAPRMRCILCTTAAG
ncbi:Vacuolar protein sorting-associated protein 41-like [Vitis vinifera]|uniref:Vacuolar protein sorting-associated protein 41-like n=1 Tax=Vitis vinifera TaxID=29760 RepID=A0A438F2X2_VITVI|nr:Vacuolar protein sorting-associated protein 41-like [Vitis vinifera]